MKDGGPAFPVHPGVTVPFDGYNGMSLRDYFAAAALQGMISGMNHAKGELEHPSWWVHTAYTLADAMLAERDK